MRPDAGKGNLRNTNTEWRHGSHAVAHIDLGVLAHNIAVVRRHIPPQVKILFVVKADAYGHGIARISRAAQEAGVDALGVITVEEGKSIRQVGVTIPILLLTPILPSEIDAALANDLTIAVRSSAQARALSQAAKSHGKSARVQVNIDTGMHRFGLPADKALSLCAEVHSLPGIELEGVFSHLTSATSLAKEDRVYTLTQVELFRALLDQLRARGLLPPLRHIANSGGLIGYQDATIGGDLNMIRIGTLLYGYRDLPSPWAEEITPVATLTAPVAELQEVAAGDFVGYDRAYRAPRAQRIAILPIGYGTGISPQFTHGEVLVHGKCAPVVGKIGLSHTAIDVSDIPQVRIGDEVEVFGPHLPADQLENKIGLSMCNFFVPALRGAIRGYQ